jgi:hypothetical protein
MATKKTICPDCGLVLEVVDERLVYDITEWRRRCKRVDLDSPLWCLVQRDGTSKPQQGCPLIHRCILPSRARIFVAAREPGTTLPDWGLDSRVWEYSPAHRGELPRTLG